MQRVGAPARRDAVRNRRNGGKRRQLAAFLAVSVTAAPVSSDFQACAADAASVPAHHTTRLILLGTAGGPGIVRQRSEPASLLVVDGRPYLIDAGEGVSRQIVLAGFQIAQVHTIFITHHHVDHNAGLEPLISLDWFGMSLAPQAPAPVQIYGPPATEHLVNAALDYLSVSERIFRAGIPDMRPAKGMFEAHDVSENGVVYTDDLVKVAAAENTHFSHKSMAADSGQDRSYAYRFDTPGGSVVFTGDTGPSDAVVKLAKGADVLVSEIRAGGPPQPVTVSTTAPSAPPNPPPPSPVTRELMDHILTEHLTPDEVGKIASHARVKLVVLTHISPSTETDMTRFTAGVKRYFSGPVVGGADFFEYDLD